MPNLERSGYHCEGEDVVRKLRLLVMTLAVGALIAIPVTPATAMVCQDPGIDGYCELQRKMCAYGSSLEERYGVGWACIH